MFYRTEDDHGLKHNPFNAIVVPRPIGWITSRDAAGNVNLAPYSFFNGVDEYEVAGLTKAPCEVIGCSRVAESPVTFECKLVQIVDLLSTDESAPNRVVFGHVVAIHISDEVIVDGIVDIDRLAPISRLGYRDYGRVSGVFSMLRPEWPIER